MLIVLLGCMSGPSLRANTGGPPPPPAPPPPPVTASPKPLVKGAKGGASGAGRSGHDELMKAIREGGKLKSAAARAGAGADIDASPKPIRDAFLRKLHSRVLEAKRLEKAKLRGSKPKTAAKPLSEEELAKKNAALINAELKTKSAEQAEAAFRALDKTLTDFSKGLLKGAHAGLTHEKREQMYQQEEARLLAALTQSLGADNSVQEDFIAFKTKIKADRHQEGLLSLDGLVGDLELKERKVLQDEAGLIHAALRDLFKTVSANNEPDSGADAAAPASVSAGPIGGPPPPPPPGMAAAGSAPAGAGLSLAEQLALKKTSGLKTAATVPAAQPKSAYLTQEDWIGTIVDALNGGSDRSAMEALKAQKNLDSVQIALQNELKGIGVDSKSAKDLLGFFPKLQAAITAHEKAVKLAPKADALLAARQAELEDVSKVYNTALGAALKEQRAGKSIKKELIAPLTTGGV